MRAKRNKNVPFTASEDKRIAFWWKRRWRIQIIASKLDRSVSGVHLRVQALGLQRRVPRGYTLDDTRSHEGRDRRCYCTAKIKWNGRCPYNCPPEADPKHLAAIDRRCAANDKYNERETAALVTREDMKRATAALRRSYGKRGGHGFLTPHVVVQ